MKIISNPEVSRPTPEPLNSSVLDHATVGTVEHFGLRNEDGLWPSYNALDTLNLIDACPDLFSGYKVFDAAEWVGSFNFALYGGAQCLALGLDNDDQKAEVGRIFQHNEGRGIEEQILNVRFSEDDVEALAVAPGAISLPIAVGLLEGAMATRYAGVPTLHVPRAAIAPLMGAGVVVEEGGKFFTRTGSKVAAGGGYDDGILTGVWTLYATGEVYIEHTDLRHEQQMVRPGDGSGLGSDENALSDNTVITLAERMYRVAVEGPVLSVDATVWKA